jgi:hypothetical protein
MGKHPELWLLRGPTIRDKTGGSQSVIVISMISNDCEGYVGRFSASDVSFSNIARDPNIEQLPFDFLTLWYSADLHPLERIRGFRI